MENKDIPPLSIISNNDQQNLFELESPRTSKRNEEKTIKSLRSLFLVIIIDIVSSILVAWWFYYISLERSIFKQCKQISSDFKIYKVGDLDCIGDDYSYDSGVISNIVVYYFALVFAPFIIITSVLTKTPKEIYKDNISPNLSLLDDKLIMTSYLIRIMTLNNYFNFYDIDKVQSTVASTQQGVGVKWASSFIISLFLVIFIITKEMSPVMNRLAKNSLRAFKLFILVILTCFIYGALVYIMNFNALNKEPWSLILPKGENFVEITYLNYGIIMITFTEFLLSISIYNMTQGRSLKDKAILILCPLNCCHNRFIKN